MGHCDLRTVEFLKIGSLSQKLWPKKREKKQNFYFFEFSLFVLVFRQNSIFIERTNGFQPNLDSWFSCKSSTRIHLKNNFTIDFRIFGPNNFDGQKNWPVAGFLNFFGFYDSEFWFLGFFIISCTFSTIWYHWSWSWLTFL